jgi:hypothetical protein
MHLEGPATGLGRSWSLPEANAEIVTNSSCCVLLGVGLHVLAPQLRSRDKYCLLFGAGVINN